jgi:hypothetical protein
MDFDLTGYLETEPLAPSRALVPLFEAVVNAIDAVECRTGTERCVTIQVERDRRQADLTEGELRGSRPIVGFRVEDNGVGFTAANYESFNISFSRYKKARGGKGVGRFSWLHAFDETIVTSVYQEDSRWHRRRFIFSTAHGGVGDHSILDTEPARQSTTVHLKGLKKLYADYCPTRADTLAWKILEHCLFTFLSPSPPAISLSDDDESTPLSINDVYAARISPFASENRVTIRSHEFRLRHLRLYSGDTGHQHSIHLCANDRDVQQHSLAKRIPSLSRKLEDEEGRSFYYQCYVESSFLDERTNLQRTSFTFPRDGELPFDGELTQESLIDELVIHSKNELRGYLDKLYETIKLKAERLVGEKYPEFRTLLKEFGTSVEEFGQDATDQELLRKFNELHFARDLDTRRQAEILLAKAEKGEYDHAYEALFKHYFESVDHAATVNLARYVIHRKAILDLLRKRMEGGADGKYAREEAIHEIVFPLRTSSDDTEYHRWNLWIIDEKLAFHFYLSSDRPISDITGDSQQSKEPDIMVIDNPAAFADADTSPLNSVVIVEFKKPERSSYGDEGESKNPIDQVQGYVRQIREKKEVTVRGRRITVRENTPFYCYILADLTPRLREIAKGRGFTSAPDDLGYFWFNPNNNAYIELLSFEKLAQDAAQRNMALFKKLGLH